VRDERGGIASQGGGVVRGGGGVEPLSSLVFFRFSLLR
jgi:hypothetical protein